MSIPHGEYPRPQFVRDEFVNLNGTWTFAFDFGVSGHEREWEKSTGFDRRITVPFCPESKLSGVGYTDFIPCMFYHRELAIPAAWRNKKVLLHFGGVDYKTFVYIDGAKAAHHVGGSSPFSVDLTPFVQAGKTHHLVLRVLDDPRGGLQPGGKQSTRYASRGCSYTRTTGIWSTVWMEAVDLCALQSCRIVPNFDASSFTFTPRFHALDGACKLKIQVGGVSREVVCAAGNSFEVAVPFHAWTPEDPFLYDVTLEVVRNGAVVDRVQSYAGMRKTEVRGDRMYLNNEPFYPRFVLDQGFYEDGLWTAPSDEVLARDIELSLAAGFNGARLHQKVFSERFHYHADRLGYLTWAEFSDWGMGFWQHFRKAPADYDASFRNYYAEWLAVLERDMNHPSIIAWTPFNETNGIWDLTEHRRFIRDIVTATRMADPSRPVNDTSGYTHVDTDLWTVHCYAADPVKFNELVGCTDRAKLFVNYPDDEKEFFAGQPYIVDEYGGVKYIPEDRKEYCEKSWGYGETPATMEDAIERIAKLTKVLVDAPRCAGYCYTQLTDIEQEQNGIYNYDRSEKFPMEQIKAIFGEKPSWSRF